MRAGAFRGIDFSIGFTNKEILNLLAHQHHIVISIRTLKRKCKKMHLFHRKNQAYLGEIAALVEEEMAGSGQLQGYQWMYRRDICHI